MSEFSNGMPNSDTTQGCSPLLIPRILVGNLHSGEVRGGGSTVTHWLGNKLTVSLVSTFEALLYYMLHCQVNNCGLGIQMYVYNRSYNN